MKAGTAASFKDVNGIILQANTCPFAIALGIGAPVSYLLNKLLFDTIYWYHMPITYSGVLLAISILILVLLVTFSTQIGKILKSNPVNGLKEE